MSRRVLTRLIAILIGAFLVAYFASPVFAVRSLINAARTGDEARLERLVDFPAVRDDLMAQLNAQLVRRFGIAEAALDALPNLASRGGRDYRPAPRERIE